MGVSLNYFKLMPLGLQIANSINAVLHSKTKSAEGRIGRSEIKTALLAVVDGICDLLPGLVDDDD